MTHPSSLLRVVAPVFPSGTTLAEAPPSAEAAPPPDDAPPLAMRLLVVYGVLLSAGLQSNLPTLMTATGASGSVLMVAAFAPLYLAAARIGLAPYRAGPPRALAGMVLALVPSMLWCEHPLDGATKFAAMGIAIAWTSLLTRWPSLVAEVLSAGLACCLAGTVVQATGSEVLPRPTSAFALFVLVAAVVRWRGAGATSRVLLRALRTIALAGLVALVFASSFRAPTFGALLIVVFFAVRSAEARVALAAVVVAGAVFFTVQAPKRAPSYSHVVERDDLVGRYEAISDDRFSGRGDIWEGILDEARTSPRWLYVGAGVGDVDFIVAQANPQIMSFNMRGERVLSPHNLGLEILVAAGVPGVLALLWLLLALATRIGPYPVDIGILTCAIVMSGSNVPTIDIGGGVVFIGLVCAHLGRQPSRSWRFAERGPAQWVTSSAWWIWAARSEAPSLSLR